MRLTARRSGGPALCGLSGRSSTVEGSVVGGEEDANELFFCGVVLVFGWMRRSEVRGMEREG
jgi:hypothetical protein